jgi:hypothetical protein
MASPRLPWSTLQMSSFFSLSLPSDFPNWFQTGLYFNFPRTKINY